MRPSGRGRAESGCQSNPPWHSTRCQIVLNQPSRSLSNAHLQTAMPGKSSGTATGVHVHIEHGRVRVITGVAMTGHTDSLPL
jgi:hypothetical protein